MTPVKRNIRRLRLAIGKSLKEMAEHLKVSYAMYKDYELRNVASENGIYYEPYISTIVRITDEFGKQFSFTMHDFCTKELVFPTKALDYNLKLRRGKPAIGSPFNCAAFIRSNFGSEADLPKLLEKMNHTYGYSLDYLKDLLKKQHYNLKFIPVDLSLKKTDYFDRKYARWHFKHNGKWVGKIKLS